MYNNSAQISSRNSNNVKLLLISKNSEIVYLTENNVRDICEVNVQYIATKLDNLKAIDFGTFYTNLSNNIHKLLMKCNFLLTAEDIISTLCSIPDTVSISCLKELYGIQGVDKEL